MSVSLEMLVQIAVFIILTVVGWGVRAIWNRLLSFEDKMDGLRKELHAEVQFYVHESTCKAHRDGINEKINALSAVHGVSMTKQGLAFVDINNVEHMRRLHDTLTPEERRAHAAQCQFKGDM